MSKGRIVLTRRQMLRGLGGVSLGLPFLPSIVSAPARAQVELERRPRFVQICTRHGGVFNDAMFPPESTLTESMELYPGLQIRRGTLRPRSEGGDAVLSQVLRAPAGELTATLAGKMNVLFGLDIPFYIAHHTGGFLGNFARNDGNGSSGSAIHSDFMPTIDQLMAWSSSFYRDLGTIRRRYITTGNFGRVSWTYSNPSTRSGGIQEAEFIGDARRLFEQLFVPPDMEPEMRRQPIVDLVLEDYRRLRNSSRRLSADDRQRLDDHMDRLAELQRRLTVTVSCGDYDEPAWTGDLVQRFQATNDVIAMAFACGTSRIAVVGAAEEHFVGYSGDWHQAVAHEWSNAGPQALLQEANRTVFRHVFLDLVRKLDAIEETSGSTVLDNTLVAWSQESGMRTHNSASIPVVTAGSAAGQLRTGQFCDYRNTTPAGALISYGNNIGQTGLLYNQWLATILQVMGLPRSEWQGVDNNGSTGYGHPQMDANYRAAYVSGVVENASDLLPLLGA